MPRRDGMAHGRGGSCSVGDEPRRYRLTLSPYLHALVNLAGVLGESDLRHPQVLYRDHRFRHLAGEEGVGHVPCTVRVAHVALAVHQDYAPHPVQSVGQ